jgi:hypothetical protein
MNKDFVNYNQALSLKELGFDEPCLTYYESDGRLAYSSITNTNSFWGNRSIVSAPLFQQAFRFFREKYGYNCFVTKSILSDKWYYYREDLSDRRNDSEPELTDKYDTYEEAESACLDKLIEIAKTK